MLAAPPPPPVSARRTVIHENNELKLVNPGERHGGGSGCRAALREQGAEQSNISPPTERFEEAPPSWTTFGMCSQSSLSPEDFPERLWESDPSESHVSRAARAHPARAGPPTGPPPHRPPGHHRQQRGCGDHYHTPKRRTASLLRKCPPAQCTAQDLPPGLRVVGPLTWHLSPRFLFLFLTTTSFVNMDDPVHHQTAAPKHRTTFFKLRPMSPHLWCKEPKDVFRWTVPAMPEDDSDWRATAVEYESTPTTPAPVDVADELLPPSTLRRSLRIRKRDEDRAAAERIEQQAIVPPSLVEKLKVSTASNKTRKYQTKAAHKFWEGLRITLWVTQSNGFLQGSS